MRKAKGIFITGTDTGVGKTVVTALLAVAFRERGLHVGVMKPIEAGGPVEDGKIQPQDALFLQALSGCTSPLELVNPYALREPLTPALAAEHEGKVIDLEYISRCYRDIASEHDITLIEGAGGLLVPITRDATMLDLIVKLGEPLLIVARNTLGVLNHTALTVNVASQYCRVAGIVLNMVKPEQDDQSQQTNRKSLEHWGHAPVFGALPALPEHTREQYSRASQFLNSAGILECLTLPADY